jgi:hypothetical protein
VRLLIHSLVYPQWLGHRLVSVSDGVGHVNDEMLLVASSAESSLNRLLGWSFELEQMYTPKVMVRDVGTLIRFVFVKYDVYLYECYF